MTPSWYGVMSGSKFSTNQSAMSLPIKIENFPIDRDIYYYPYYWTVKDINKNLDIKFSEHDAFLE